MNRSYSFPITRTFSLSVVISFLLSVVHFSFFSPGRPFWLYAERFFFARHQVKRYKKGLKKYTSQRKTSSKEERMVRHEQNKLVTKGRTTRKINPIQTGLFWSCGTEGGGGGGLPPPTLDSENVKAMITKLKGQIVLPKMFPFRSAISADDVI